MFSLLTDTIFPPKVGMSILNDPNCFSNAKEIRKRKYWLSKKVKNKGLYGERQEKIGLILKQLFHPLPFEENLRPDWLRGVKDRNLELDFYCKELKLAFEVQGEVHYHYKPNFHGTYEAFEDLQRRDALKRLLCKKLGVKLIEIPYFIPLDDIREYILLKVCKL